MELEMLVNLADLPSINVEVGDILYATNDEAFRVIFVDDDEFVGKEIMHGSEFEGELPGKWRIKMNLTVNGKGK